MDTRLPMDRAAGYTSASQRARVISEAWIATNLYCPRCGQETLTPLANNTQASDFCCPTCGERFEVKSGKSRFGARVVNGAYHTLVRRLEADDSPNLVLLRFDGATHIVTTLEIVPRQFFVAAIVERRPPLAASARRAGWVGSTIRLDRIPAIGRLAVVDGTVIADKSDILRRFAATRFLHAEPPGERTWLTLTMRVLDELGPAFTLADVYRREGDFARAFPANSNVRAKIRQQLQVLRDRSYLSFLGAGRYRKAAPAQPARQAPD